MPRRFGFLENPSLVHLSGGRCVCAATYVHDDDVADFIYVCLSLEHNAERGGFVGGRDVGFSFAVVFVVSFSTG